MERGIELALFRRQGLQPALTAEGKADPVTDFDNLGFAELAFELRPQRIVGLVGVVDDGVGITQRDFFTSRKFFGFFVLHQLEHPVVGIPRGPRGSLIASVAAFDGVCDVGPQQFLEVVFDDAGAVVKEHFPRQRE